MPQIALYERHKVLKKGDKIYLLAIFLYFHNNKTDMTIPVVSNTVLHRSSNADAEIALNYFGEQIRLQIILAAAMATIRQIRMYTESRRAPCVRQ